MQQRFEHGYALLVGVGESAYAPWSLPVTVKDARALHAVLTDPQRCAYPPDDAHIRLLTDRTASRAAILDGLAWLQQCATQDAGATVVVYFSGHGCSHSASGRYFLLPHDVTPFDIPATGLAAEDFTQALRAISAARLFVIVDACHASGMAAAKDEGDAPSPARFPSGFQSEAIPKQIISSMSQGAGRAVFTSSRSGQQSFVRPDGAMSIYTWRLIEALQGAACAPGETTVRLSHLMSHVARWTPADAQRFYQAKQTPFFDAVSEDFVVALTWGGAGVSGNESKDLFTPAAYTATSAVVSGLGVAAQQHSVAVGAAGVAVLGNRNQVTHVHQEVHGNLYVGEPPEQADNSEALATYLRTFIAKHARLTMRGIGWQGSDPTSERMQMDLEQVFVMLDTTTFQDKPGSGARVNDDTQHGAVDTVSELMGGQPLSVLDAVIQNRRMVLLGEPGAGKTTALHYMGLALALHQADPMGGWLAYLPGWPKDQGHFLPIYVVLRDFARRARSARDGEHPQFLWNFITSQLAESNLGRAESVVRHALEKGTALILLDGLDEIPHLRQLEFVRAAITAFMQRYPECRVVITCRTLTYQSPQWRLPNLPSFTIARLTHVQIERFIHQWYAELARINIISHRNGQELAVRLGRAVAQPDLHELATNPLLLTVMALVHTHKGRLPDARSLLYEETVDLLLLHWEEIKNPAGGDLAQLRRLLREVNRSDVDLKRALWQLAYQSHAAGAAAPGDAGLSDIHEYTLERALAGLHPQQSRDWAIAVIQTLKLRSGLLLERAPEIYAFPHRTFQEFLAGAHLATQPDFGQQAAQLASAGSYWHQAIQLAVGRLVHVAGDIDRPLALAAELCPSRVPDCPAAWRNVHLTGLVLQEIGLNRAQERALGKELIERVRCRLAASLRQSGATPVERVAAGRLLADLDDPRFQPDNLHLPQDSRLGFIFIPPGPFVMGDPSHEHIVDLPGFFIARFPVTVAQYRAFLLDTTHHSQSGKAATGPENAPVTGVSWLQALEYCNWLTRGLQQLLSSENPFADFLRQLGAAQYWRAVLPSEAEWEKAGRGGLLIPQSPISHSQVAPAGLVENPLPRRTFPWGDAPHEHCANLDAARIGGPCSVGCFGEGASPYGVEDLCGNVWEWTRTAWGDNVAVRDYSWPYNSSDGRERFAQSASVFRVLKGGAFFNTHGQATCSAADRNYPDLPINHVGFRIALLPSE